MSPGEDDHEELRESLAHKLQVAKVDADIVTMPDFFLDHSITYYGDTISLTKRLLSVASRGGGEIPDIPQSLEAGGNAAICTLALATLGVRVHPIMKTNRLGHFLVRYFYEPLGVDLTHVKLDGTLSPTIILELRYGKRMVNVMLGDISGVSEFGFSDLDPEDLATITNTHYVCVFNWLYNRKGTELAERVFKYCKEKSHARTFFDPADVRPRRKDLPNLVARAFRGEFLDGLGVNENEAIVLASMFDKKVAKLAERKGAGATALEAGKAISNRTGVKVYVHTADYSSSINQDQIALVPSFRLQVRRGTGAGDCWNAGSLVADSLKFSGEEKLLFANAVAGRYISNPSRSHATLRDVVDFLQNPSNKLKEVAVKFK